MSVIIDQSDYPEPKSEPPAYSYGVVCGARHLYAVVPTDGKFKIPRRAKCNRWAGHVDRHRETDPKTFEVRDEWDESESEARG